MSADLVESTLTTADLASAGEKPAVAREGDQDPGAPAIGGQLADATTDDKQLAALFLPDVAQDFRSRWDDVQRSFVDDPGLSVRQADELVAQVMKRLAETFSTERASLEAQVNQTDQASTENLRVALRRYRSFFERLLSL